MNPERWQQVKTIFHRAVEFDTAERTVFVRESCGDDEELRSEVESLLDSDEEPGSVLENPIVSPGAIAAAVPVRNPASVLGRTIGNYVITRELARGGMGVVYRARHVSLPRDAVIKCIRTLALSEEAQTELRARFKREAHIQSQLDHAHIVRVYEFFDFADEYFLVMEYVPGSSVRSMLDKSGRLPVEQATRLAAQALEGLGHAHGLRYTDESGTTSQGVIHRDIKPGNLLVDDEGNLKVADFGIAKITGKGDLTKIGFNPGTFEYMSPEQIRGQPVDARSDLYSLGVTLYEMLTGRLPFPRTDAGYDSLKSHVESDPPPIRNLNPDVPAGVADVVTRSLRREPGQRWQTAAEFRDALIASSGTQPVKTEPRTVPRRWIPVAGVAALVLAAVAVSGVFWMKRDVKPSIAVLPFDDISAQKDQEYFSDGLAEELLDGLAKIPGLRVVGKTSSFQFKGKNEDSRVIGRKLNVETILEGSVRKQGNQVRITAQLIRAADASNLWSETYQREMRDLFAVQEEIAHAVTGELKVKLMGGKTEGTPVKSTNPEAYNSYLQGRYLLERRNKENVQKALTYFEQSIKLDPGYARAWVGLAAARNAQADSGIVPSEEGYRAARAAADRALALDAGLAEAHAVIGSIQRNHEDWPGADASFRRALALEPGNPIVVGGAGGLAFRLGRWDEAIALYRRAIDIDPLKPNLYFALGHVLFYAGRHEEAMSAIQKALELAPEMQTAHAVLGQVYLAEGQPEQALAEMQKEKHPAFGGWGLAMAYHALGRKKDSDASLSELITKHPAETFAIAEVYAFRGETDLAFEWLDRAYREQDPGLSEMQGDPTLKSLVRDPRYTALLQKMRLPTP